MRPAFPSLPLLLPHPRIFMARFRATPLISPLHLRTAGSNDFWSFHHGPLSLSLSLFLLSRGSMHGRRRRKRRRRGGRRVFCLETSRRITMMIIDLIMNSILFLFWCEIYFERLIDYNWLIVNIINISIFINILLRLLKKYIYEIIYSILIL